MRQIKISFRAVFDQPIGVLNPMGLKLPAPLPVELVGSGTKWEAQSIAGPKPRKFDKLRKFASLTDAKQSVQDAFQTQLEPWQAWATVPWECELRLLDPSEYSELAGAHSGTFMIKTSEDYTHILHGLALEKGKGLPTAACGKQVDAKCFISNRANVEPSCKGCAEVWKREYKNR